MRSGLKWRPFNSLGSRGGAWSITLDPCPLCGAWAKAEFKDSKLIGLKHSTYPLDLACPYIQRENANPHNRFQRVVFNYADLEDRMFSAKAANRKEANRVSRLDGRPTYSSDDSVDLEDAL